MVAKQPKTVTLPELLENVQEGSGIEVVRGMAVAVDRVLLGTIDSHSFAHRNPKNHHLASPDFLYIGSPSEVLDAIRERQFKLVERSHADMDGPIYTWYQVSR